MPKDKLARWITPRVMGHEHKFEFGASKTTSDNGHSHSIMWKDGSAYFESSNGHDHGDVYVGTADHGK